VLRKICLLSDHHVCVNPRLWKEAFFYEKKGFEVVILGMWQSKDFWQKDVEILNGHAITYKPYLNLIPGEINFLLRFFYRARKRAASEVQRLLKIGTGWAISHAPELMLKKALAEDGHLYSAHLECAFFVSRDLIKAGKKVSFDFEDWYSRDYLTSYRPIKLLETLEKFALKHALFCTAASNAMAVALKESYQTNKEITVIYNGFSINESVKKNFFTTINENNNYIKLLWFSRTIGPDRGIEFLLKALLVCKIPVELHLLGEMSAGYIKFLEQKFAYLNNHSLIVHSFIPHHQLLSFISQFKIGLAIEGNINDNKTLTISNKILQYLQAGLRVIASDTKGQQEVANFFPANVTIVDIEKPHQIVDAIYKLRNTEQINKEAQLNQFRKIFSWEAQEKKLSSLLEKNL
jgi:glycosyltransferase involved in cell wall biosynthesis